MSLTSNNSCTCRAAHSKLIYEIEERESGNGGSIQSEKVETCCRQLWRGLNAKQKGCDLLQATLAGHDYYFYRSAWPTGESSCCQGLRCRMGGLTLILEGLGERSYRSA